MLTTEQKNRIAKINAGKRIVPFHAIDQPLVDDLSSIIRELSMLVIDLADAVSKSQPPARGRAYCENTSIFEE